MRQVDAVIFDLDGVIVDSEIWWDDVRRDFAARHHRPWTEADRESVMGANSREWSRTMQKRLDLDITVEEIEREIVAGVVARYAEAGAPTIDGAVGAVRRIAIDRPVALASSAHPAVIRAALEATGLATVFGAVVSSDEVAAGKPEPGVFIEAARRLRVAPPRCLVVEDSLNGVRAGRTAGMVVVLVPNRTIPPAPGTAELAHAVIENLAVLDPGAIESRSDAPFSGT